MTTTLLTPAQAALAFRGIDDETLPDHASAGEVIAWLDAHRDGLGEFGTNHRDDEAIAMFRYHRDLWAASNDETFAGRELRASDARAQSKNRVTIETYAAVIDTLTQRHDQHQQYTLAENERVHREGQERYAALRPYLDESGNGGVARVDQTRPRLLRADEPLADFARARAGVAAGELSFGRYLRGIGLGDWNGAEAERECMEREQRQIGTGIGGGVLVPTAIAASIFDVARAAAVTQAAGVRTFPMTEGKVTLPRVESDPTFAWTGESTEITDSDPTYSGLTLDAKKASALTRVSIELLQDAGFAVEQTLLSQFGAALAVELDRVTLTGSGTGDEPEGIRNATGVTIQQPFGVDGGTPDSYDFIVDAFDPVRAVNYEPSGWIVAPRTVTTLSKLADNTGQPLVPPEDVRNVRRYSTTGVPIDLTTGVNADTSDLYTGAFDQAVLGVRLAMIVIVLRDRYAEFGEVGFLVHTRVDVGVIRPSAFAVAEGIRAA